MNLSSLPSDDLPAPVTPEDSLLRQRLEESLGKRFYEACDGVTQALLMRCQWCITTQAIAPTLVIVCPDATITWQILNHIVPLGQRLEQFGSHARIRVCPPASSGTPFDIRVDEISLYRDPL